MSEALPAGMKTTRRAPSRRSHQEKTNRRYDAQWDKAIDGSINDVEISSLFQGVIKEFFGYKKEMESDGASETYLYTRALQSAFLNILARHDAQYQALKSIVRDMHAEIQQMKSDATAKAPLEYRGIFRAGIEYDPGSVTTHQGSMWHAGRKTSATPGDGSPDWTLCVKRGAPGRDLTKEIR